MNAKENAVKKPQTVPPDGGWGYFVAIGLALSCISTLIPIMSFGLIFGDFLATLGDETTGTTVLNGVFNTFFNTTGLLANKLLLTLSYRKVAFLGSFIFILGSFGTIFTTGLFQLVVTFGVLQGIGFGLIYPSVFTAFNFYFSEKIGLMNNLTQAAMVLSAIVFPYCAKYFMNWFGYRGTLAILAAISLNSLVSSMVLLPVQWYQKPIECQLKNPEEPSTFQIEEPLPKQESFWESLNLELLTESKYLNISLGLALGFVADAAFISILPAALSDFDFHTKSTFVSIFFASDFLGRVLLSLLSTFSNSRNRYLFFGGSLTSAVIRILFLLSPNYFWKLCTVCGLGFSRSFIQTPIPLVISEEYSDKFSTAFSLFMVVCGLVSLVLGALLSGVKFWTSSNVLVVSLLSLANTICVLAWTVEIFSKKARIGAKNAVI